MLAYSYNIDTTRESLYKLCVFFSTRAQIMNTINTTQHMDKNNTQYWVACLYDPGSGAGVATNGCTKQSGLYTMTDPSQEQSAILYVEYVQQINQQLWMHRNKRTYT